MENFSWAGLQPTTFETNLTCSPNLALFVFFPIYNSISHIVDQCRFLTSPVGHDVLIDIFEDDIIFLIWADQVSINFSLKQKQRFPV